MGTTAGGRSSRWRPVFHTAPIGWDAWLRILAIALAASLVVAIEKRMRRGSMDRSHPEEKRS